ncbi:MAG: DUF1302 family protein [Porticoccaceae bacterium]
MAWGEALFFRVADAPSGLDFRCHVIFDFGAEEFADERLAAPGVRLTYNFNEKWDVEVFAQMFQPTILPNNYTPYNLIGTGYNVDYQSGIDAVDNNINGGIRLKGEIGNLGVQFFAISHHNPDPIFNLRAGGQKLIPDSVCADPAVPAVSKAFCGFDTQPFVFEPGGMGATSPQEWFYAAAIQGAPMVFKCSTTWWKTGLGLQDSRRPSGWCRTLTGTLSPQSMPAAQILSVAWCRAVLAR